MYIFFKNLSINRARYFSMITELRRESIPSIPENESGKSNIKEKISMKMTSPTIQEKVFDRASSIPPSNFSLFSI